MKHALVFGWTMALLCFGGRARAELTWTAPPECPSSQTVNARIKALVANDQALASFHGEATVAAHPERPLAWQVVIRTTGSSQDGERLFEGATCTSVADATAVFVALMLSPPSGEVRAHPPAPKRTKVAASNEQMITEAEPATPQEQGPSATALPVVEAKAAVPPIVLGIRMRITGGASLATLPNTTAAVGFAVGADFLERLSWLAFELGARAHRSTQTAPPAAPAAYATVVSGALDAGASLCVRTPNHDLFARGCVMGALQRLKAESQGVAMPGQNTVWLPMGGVTALGGWNMGHGLAVIVEARADHRFRAPAFTLPPWGTVWAAPELTFGLGLGIEWRP